MIALFSSRGPTSSREEGRSLPAPFNQRGKARLAQVGREVIFGSCTYTYGSLRPARLSRWKCTLASSSVSSARNLSVGGSSPRKLPGENLH
jgi:hypothetical protein